jgi:energy-coupling factor transporter transmembrane protein EcfT
MIRGKLKDILSLNGISIFIGIVGGIFGFVSIFINDWGYKIGVKWFALVIIVALFVVLIMAKLAYELYTEIGLVRDRVIRVISYLPNSSTFLIDRNAYFEYSARVSVFYIDHDFQVELAQGYVQNIQDKFIQIKLIEFNNDFVNNYPIVIRQLNNNNSDVLSTLVIKNYIRYTE